MAILRLCRFAGKHTKAPTYIQQITNHTASRDDSSIGRLVRFVSWGGLFSTHRREKDALDFDERADYAHRTFVPASSTSPRRFFVSSVLV